MAVNDKKNQRRSGAISFEREIASFFTGNIRPTSRVLRKGKGPTNRGFRTQGGTEKMRFQDEKYTDVLWCIHKWDFYI
jgi:hypothetical protein